MLKRIATGLLGLTLLVVTATNAFAHSHYDHSTPGDGETVQAAPTSVTIWYTEGLQAQNSWIHVLTEAGQRVDMDDSVLTGDDNTGLMVHLQPNLPAGLYTVSWQNLSEDGDGLTGQYKFGIGMAAPMSDPAMMDDDEDHNIGDHDHH